MGLLDQLLGLSGSNSNDWVSQMQSQMMGGPLVGPLTANGGQSAMLGAKPPQAGARKMFPAPDAPQPETPRMSAAAPAMTEAPGVGTYLKGALQGFAGKGGGSGILGAIGGAMDAGDAVTKQNELFQTLTANGVEPRTAALMIKQPEAYKVVEARRANNMTRDALLKSGKASPEEVDAAMANPAILQSLIKRVWSEQEPTADERQYERAKKEGFAGTFMDYQQALRKSGATSINMAGDKAWEVERAKLGAKKLADLSDSANSMAQVVDQMETMQQALDAYNQGSIFGSGSIAPYEVQMRSFLKGLGVGNADTLAGGELARSVQNQMALLVRNPESGMGMPGALSDADRQFLVQTMPGLDKSPQGNRIMIAVAKKAAQRKMEIASLAEQYAAQNGGMEGFQAALKQWAEANPMLDDALKAEIAAAKGVPQADAGPARTGPNPRAGFVTPANAADQTPTIRKFNPATGRIE